MTRIAVMTLEARRTGSQCRSLFIAVSTPEIDPKDSHDDTYRTLIELEHFYKPLYIYGADSLQSLGLAISMIQARLQTIVDDGWTLFYPGTEDIADPRLMLDLERGSRTEPTAE